MIYELLKKLKSGTGDETNGRHIIPNEVVRSTQACANPRILDIGAGRGTDLKMISTELVRLGKKPELFAIESFPLSVQALRELGVFVTDVDIEHATFPFESEFFDAVICNQVLEHTKEIFWIVAEIARVMKRGATLVLGVPNLGSLHNRAALLAGFQPPAIAVFGPHVRGFTVPGLVTFLEKAQVLKVRKVLGGNFYPFPAPIARVLARLFPSFAVSSFYVVERCGERAFLSIFESEESITLVDTPYFRGKGDSQR